MSSPGDQYLEARFPWVPEHGYVLSVTSERLEELEDDISAQGTCSQAVPKIPAAMRRRWMLCFISVKKGYLTHVARSVVYYPAESGRDKLDIWNVTQFAKPVRVATLKAKIEGRQAWRAKQALDGGHVSPAAFVLIMDALRRVDGGAAEGLIDRRPAPLDPTPTQAKANWAYQRDAVVTSLEIARIPKEQFKASPQLDENAPAALTSIFDGDDDVTSMEDLVILQDLDEANEDWKFVKRQRYPAKLFTNGDTKLTIILANKLPLERQLGVDLIYVNETLKSVVFVQYKMFAGVDGEGGYRPDGQLNEEITRMDAAAAKLATVAADESCDGYRFGPDPFFLKFCSKLLSHDATGHVPGIYVPLGYWKRLVQTPVVKGKKGGTIVYSETFGRRHFTPTHFIDMVGRGWIGTSALQTDVLAPYLRAALQGDKGLVLAVQSSNAAHPDGADEDEESFEPPRRIVAPPKPRYPGKKPKTIQI
ncbi:hypothetical protein [Insolitispirillum peregrinum]|uniref:Uncharacterized protein n=1 Tax=Insolitispirillum peregrinum TaxID=80876 RepID=A0A1N7PTR5_9PROT|nr:hypothetical protein [Insolitispirillum peregrinum]SIT14043.1 hypothetical protein SAMN05421779_10853 [Insolitispirillum peregrinum]